MENKILLFVNECVYTILQEEKSVKREKMYKNSSIYRYYFQKWKVQ